MHGSFEWREQVENIVNTYGDMLYRICYVLLKNESDAEDAVSETFIKYLEKKPELKDCEHTKAWLIKVAKNKCFDMLRYKAKHQNLDIDTVKEISVWKRDNNILETLMSLPEKFSVVLMLYYVEGYHIKEIAEILGKTQSAIKMRLKKARELLKTEVSRNDD